MFADQPVDCLILSKIFYSWSENDQFGTVRKRHSSSIDGLIPQPRTLRFVRIQVHNRLSYFTVERKNVDFKTQLRSSLEAVVIIAYEKSFYCQSPVFVSPHYSKDIDDRQMLDEMSRRVVQDPPHWIVGSSHDPFHTVNGAEKMTAVDTVRSAGTNQDVLVIVRHPDNFMWNHLPDRQNQVEIAFDQHAVNLNRPGVVELTFRLRVHIVRGHLPQCDGILSPVMCVEQIEWYTAEHSVNLGRRHRSVCSYRR